MPRQPANQTRAHPAPPELPPPPHAGLRAYAVLAAVSGCCPPVQGRLPTRYSPVRHWAAQASAPKSLSLRAPFDLHVLGTPPAFILSQDQTLIKSFFRPAIFIWYPWLTVFRLHLKMPVLLNVFRPFAEDPAPYLGQELFFRIFQGHSIVQLSRFCLLLSCATTSIVYHSFSCLSTTFFKKK